MAIKSIRFLAKLEMTFFGIVRDCFVISLLAMTFDFEPRLDRGGQARMIGKEILSLCSRMTGRNHG